ncbi:MAG: PQQ-binding-like beta-propeller repeat protein [Kiritimatiellaeota bacterium]|nr:PQQ-binding-like beta-propeller repeat protein [Kiritimatiellota bacterium]
MYILSIARRKLSTRRPARWPAAILGLSLAGGWAGAADWPQWRGPTRDGLSAETGWSTAWPADGPRQLWKFSAGIGCSSVSVSQGRVYTLGNRADTDTVYALDEKTGAVLWKHSYACPLDPNLFEGGPAATPTVDGDRVYTLSRSGHLCCLRADTGQVLWAKNLSSDLGGKRPTWGYAGSPVVVEKRLILDVGAPGAATMALDKLTGQVLWKNGKDSAGYSTLLPFVWQGQTVLASFNAAGLAVRAANDGKELAHFPWKTSYDVNAATPIVAGGKIFISSGYNRGGALLQLSAGNLKALWEHKKMRNHFNSCVLWQGQLYGFDESTLTCLDFATGAARWQQEGLGKGSLMLAGGKLVIQSEKGDLVIADAAPGAYRELARAKVLGGRCWVVPVLANGRVYCKNNNGELVCLDVSGK